jgi:starch phosphorylase
MAICHVAVFVNNVHATLFWLNFRDFYELWPHKFNNKTNGITPRRWLLGCNPGLRQLITEKIGDKWVADLQQIRQIADFVDDSEFRSSWSSVKQANKERLAQLIQAKCNVTFNQGLFDVQVKRIHEYKRQL